MVQFGMLKQKAIELLGGTLTATADAIGISYQAVVKWPESLPPRIADRVIAACVRSGVSVPKDVLNADGKEQQPTSR